MYMYIHVYNRVQTLEEDIELCEAKHAALTGQLDVARARETKVCISSIYTTDATTAAYINTSNY
jgi:hypothetical protein